MTPIFFKKKSFKRVKKNVHLTSPLYLQKVERIKTEMLCFTLTFMTSVFLVTKNKGKIKP